MSYEMRAPCAACGSTRGVIKTTNGQDIVRCLCGKYQYCAPKEETGRGVRTVSRGTVKPKKRAAIIERANGRCEACGVPSKHTETGLHVGHVVSVEDGRKYGLTDQEINSDENLIAECDECNLGHSAKSIPIRMLIAIIKGRFENDTE